MTILPNDSVLNQLRAMGFDNTISETKRRLIVSVSGKEGTGKSNLLFTATPPVFLFDIDTGSEGVVEKFQQAGNDIYIYSIRVPKDATQDIYQGMWAAVKDRIKMVYKVNEGTLGMDTQTEIYELARLAHFGKLTQVMPHHYAEVKSQWREILKLGYDSKMNTVLINKIKPIWVNNTRTKDYEISGFDETPYAVQVALTSFREQTENGVVFGYTIDKCRKRASLIGQEYRTIMPIVDDGELHTDPIVNFPFLLNLVHGEEK